MIEPSNKTSSKRQKISDFLRRRAGLIAFVVLAAAVFYSISANMEDTKRQNVSTRSDQLAGCERTNLLRAQLNQQSDAFLQHNRITYTLFLKISKTPNLQAEVREDVNTAVTKYRKLAHNYKPLPIIDCDKAYPAEGAAPRQTENLLERTTSREVHE